MPPSAADYTKRIKSILRRVQLLPDAAKAPILHYRRTVTEIWGAFGYVERVIGERERRQAVVDRHLGKLYGMALVNLVETFERFLKEVAAECVDCLADLIVDDRFNAFALQGASLASHFGSGSAGKALCEAATWLDCKQINDRFRQLLTDPFKPGDFYVFPKEGNQQPVAQQWRYDLMSLIWQLRHTAVHNVGVITKSDAVKLRVWAKEAVEAPRVLAPARNDIRWLKMFLDETVEDCNRRIGQRLADLLTVIHTTAPAILAPTDLANRITAAFQVVLSVAGVAGTLPPP
ncbi:MAG TPA: hypothetical protein VH682_25010 [Gemmataceae bacterium]|jgi:hypothetical protein